MNFSPGPEPAVVGTSSAISVIMFAVGEKCSTIEIHRQLIQVHGDDVMRVQRIRKWRRKLQNGRKDITPNIFVA